MRTNQQTTQHSPLPWQIAEYGIRELKAKYLCIKHGDQTIARIDASGNSLSVTKRDEANARIIVASVTHAEALADELRKVLQFGSAGNENLIRATLAAWEEAKQ